MLAFAGTCWTSFPVVRSQGAQGAPENGETYDTEFRKGLDLLRRRRYEDALKSFKRANEMRNKQSAECFFGMAQAYVGLEAYKNVVESCDRIIEFSAGDIKMQAQAYSLKGTALQTQAESKDQKKLQDAEATFRQGLALNTDLPILHYNLGFTLLQESHDPDGIVELKKYVELVPEGAKSEEALKLIENPRRAREAYAPDFSFTTSEGEFISLDDLRGKVVLLDFWGTWCPPWRDFIAKNQMVWPQYLDRDRHVQRAFDVRAFPTYIVIDHEGIVRYRNYGASMEKDGKLEDAVRKQIKILGKTSPTE
jgi:tetratricopeptide (TPR) repeat protein